MMNKKHECVFGFEERYVGKVGIYEPKLGERGYSIKKDDWVCRCGRTRREALKKSQLWVCEVVKGSDGKLIYRRKSKVREVKGVINFPSLEHKDYDFVRVKRGSRVFVEDEKT